MAYPSTLDVLTDPAGSQAMDDPALLHSVVEKSQNDSIEAIQSTLGLLPQGGSATVAARLAALDSLVAGKAATTLIGAPSGIAGLDSGGRLAQNVDASKLDAGVLAVARVPALDASKITTGVFAVARIPALATTQVTSGVFDAARIPGLDGSKITTGTIAAARLPSSVTANANARVVADQAGRDAIPLVDRADGMLVMSRSPQPILWQWRADNSTWLEMATPIVDPFQVDEQTDLSTSTTSFAAGSPGLSQVFTAPASGKIVAVYSAHMAIASGTGSGYFGGEVRTGSSIGAGSVHAAAITDECVTVGGAANIRGQASREVLISGLTPGNTYHVRTMFLVTSGSLSIFSRQLMVRPYR